MINLNKSFVSSGAAQLFNTLFPIVTTPLVAHLAGARSYGIVGLVALVAYVQAAVVDAGVTNYAIVRWGRSGLSNRGLTRIWASLSVAQVALGGFSAALIFGVCFFWLKLDIQLILLALVSGFAPVLYPGWALIIRGSGRVALIATVAARALSLGLLLVLLLGGGRAITPTSISFCWILVPSILPVVFTFPYLVKAGQGKALISKRLIRSIGADLAAGVSIKVCVAIYGSLLAILMGRFAPKAQVASYMFADRMRVIGQAVIASQYPNLFVHLNRHLDIRKTAIGIGVIFAILFSIAFFTLSPYVQLLFPRDRGWIFDAAMVHALGVMGAVVVFSNTVLYMAYMPLFGQRAVAALLRRVTVLALVIVPGAYFQLGKLGAIFAIILIEVVIAVFSMRGVTRQT